jgi:hypothetical protein
MSNYRLPGQERLCAQIFINRYGLEVGFRSMEILPIDTFFFRFYRLR